MSGSPAPRRNSDSASGRCGARRGRGASTLASKQEYAARRSAAEAVQRKSVLPTATYIDAAEATAASRSARARSASTPPATEHSTSSACSAAMRTAAPALPAVPSIARLVRAPPAPAALVEGSVLSSPSVASSCFRFLPPARDAPSSGAAAWPVSRGTEISRVQATTSSGPREAAKLLPITCM